MKLIVGLHNPGKDYEGSRHNAGAMAVRLLADRLGLKLEPKTNAWIAHGSLHGKPLILALPRTSMNLSGEVVGPLFKQHGIKSADLVVAYDEMDLLLGAMRVRPDGSAGGHNGMKSIIAHTGTNKFSRVRVGIGRPTRGDQINWVLGKFTSDEQVVLKRVLERAADALECLLTEGVDEAMNRFNRKPPEKEEQSTKL